MVYAGLRVENMDAGLNSVEDEGSVSLAICRILPIVQGDKSSVGRGVIREAKATLDGCWYWLRRGGTVEKFWKVKIDVSENYSIEIGISNK